MIGDMLNSTPWLPTDPMILQGIIAQLHKQLDEQMAARQHERAHHVATLEQQRQRIDQLLEYIELLRRKRFGPSADRVPDAQLKLFDEAELEALIGELEAQLPAAAPPPPPKDTIPDPTLPPKRQPVRRPLPAHLPRVERILDLSADEQAALGADWTFIGYDTSEQLAVIFAHLPTAKTPAAIAALLPHNLKLDDLKREGSILYCPDVYVVRKTPAHSARLLHRRRPAPATAPRSAADRSPVPPCRISGLVEPGAIFAGATGAAKDLIRRTLTLQGWTMDDQTAR